MGGQAKKACGWVLTGPWATIFVTDGNSKKTSNQKEAQQTSKKTLKQSKNAANKINVTGLRSMGGQNKKTAQKKEQVTHETSRNKRTQNTVITSSKSSSM